MKRIALSVGLIAAATALSAQTLYFDFGGSGSRGTVTPAGADANGNHWNNITPATEGATSIAAKTAFNNLIDSNGNDTGMSLILCNAWGVNGNLGGGGLLKPDKNQLGDLAIESATCDYIFNTNNTDGGRSFVITGLNKNKGYKFKIFGSRSASDKREGLYSFSGQNGSAVMMQVAGAGIGAAGENQNTGNAPETEVVFPDASGNITLYIHHSVSTYVPLSLMKMETVDATRTFDGTVSRTMLFDFGQNSNPTAGWNNIVNSEADKYCAAGTEFTNFVDTNGNAVEGMKLTSVSQFSTNGGSGGGGLLSPDSALLGDLGVADATRDYFYTESNQTECSFSLSGLNPAKSYRLHIFGTRSNAECRVGLYHVEGLTKWYGAQQVAGNAFSGTASQNTANILITEPIFPTKEGVLDITVINNAKTYVALSAMKIEELSGVARPDIINYESVTLTAGAAAGEDAAFVSTSRNNWYLWAKLNAGTASLVAIDEFGEPKTINVDVAKEGIYRIDADLDAATATLFECTYFCLEGSAWGGWSTTGQEMNYIGSGRWNYKGTLNGYDKNTDSGRINFIMNKSWSYQYKRVAGSPDKLAFADGEDIPLNPGNYDITVDLNAMAWSVANGADQLDPYRIIVMGSSVSNGQGADQIDGYNHGYAYQYNQLLDERYNNSTSANPFYISNIAINGNSTVNLLNRYDDLQREYGKYVVFAVSLGNEGIHGASNQSAIYNQFKTNMLNLIDKARADGKVPVVTNNYTRADFNDDDYTYIKAMNREIAAWDVPSINLFGAIDDGAGHWASGFDIPTDIYHPNQAGHDEFFYAHVPSMFDALKAGKTLEMNRRTPATPFAFPAQNVLTIEPEGTMHSFTLSLTAAMSKDGTLATVDCQDGTTININRVGTDYTITDNAPAHIQSHSEAFAPAQPLDNIVLTHNYAAHNLTLFVNGEPVATRTTSLQPVRFSIGAAEEADDAVRTVGEVMLHRSSLLTHNPLEDTALNKSSLEIYSPLAAGLEAGEVENLAMSTNAAILTGPDSSAIADANADAPFFSAEGVDGAVVVRTSQTTNVTVVDLTGRMVASQTVDGAALLGVQTPGIYLVNNVKVIVK